MNPLKRSLALVLRDDAGRLLVVRRPPDEHDELAGIWGLPAGTTDPDESLIACARRVATEKLAVELSACQILRTGEVERPTYRLQLSLVGARHHGEPQLSKAPAGDTRTFYQELAWTNEPGRYLRPGAERGSLCCRLYLELEEGE